MAFTHTKNVDIGSFIKARRPDPTKKVRIRPDPDLDPQHCVSRSKRVSHKKSANLYKKIIKESFFFFTQSIFTSYLHKEGGGGLL
jgi:hypothetical protein